jgi:hypothetical protein
MSHLQRLAHASRKAVVAAIHQPRSAIWSLFDKVRPALTVVNVMCCASKMLCLHLVLCTGGLMAKSIITLCSICR